MNDFLPETWDEQVHRLAVGLRLVDAVRGGRPVLDASVASEDVPRPHRIPPAPPVDLDPGIGLAAMAPKRNGRFAVLYPVVPATRTSLTVRVFHHRRRFVPRRLVVPFPLLADVEAEERASTTGPAYPRVRPRGRAIALFPGSAYDTSGATGVRSRVVRADGTPVPWARVWATSGTRSLVEGVAHADDRGEFVLLLRSLEVLLIDAPSTQRAVVLHAALPPATSDSPGDPARDPLATLPVETLPALGALGPDRVSAGEEPPPSYATSASTLAVTCPMGRVVAAPPFVVS